MKKNILIVLFLIICIMGAFALKANSQPSYLDTPYAKGDVKFICNNITGKFQDTGKRTLIADETWLTYQKTGAKIVTSLESVFQQISLKWGTEFKKITITYKAANGQRYKEYVILISEQTANNIKQWAKKNL